MDTEEILYSIIAGVSTALGVVFKVFISQIKKTSEAKEELISHLKSDKDQDIKNFKTMAKVGSVVKENTAVLRDVKSKLDES